MGEREMFLVLASLFFFSMTSLSVNRFCLNNSEILMQSEHEKYAISLAQSIIEDAKTRAFDVATEAGPSSNPPSDFTYPASARNDEYYPNYSDVDDFTDIDIQVNNGKATYNVTAYVGYVEDTNPAQFVSHRTYYKKMVVTVSSDVLPRDIALSQVYSYFFFD
ncbi:hypothetical protein GF337_06175 [candidate division KSB1 bacterium]|nr:hypothetical protein [candidate division KSB1 bacterium]